VHDLQLLLLLLLLLLILLILLLLFLSQLIPHFILSGKLQDGYTDESMGIYDVALYFTSIIAQPRIVILI
jgi:hypothetical protein